VYQRGCVFYALLGTSMHLQIGPTSLVRRPLLLLPVVYECVS
jgi:disulfide bond formation protein DsbB